MDRRNPREWFYALMDYGTFLAAQSRVRTGGPAVPDALRRSTRYRRQGEFAGSHRQLRGKILEVLLEKGGARAAQIEAVIGGDPRMERALEELVAEGFLRQRGQRYSFK